MKQVFRTCLQSQEIWLRAQKDSDIGCEMGCNSHPVLAARVGSSAPDAWGDHPWGNQTNSLLAPPEILIYLTEGGSGKEYLQSQKAREESTFLRVKIPVDTKCVPAKAQHSAHGCQLGAGDCQERREGSWKKKSEQLGAG